VSPKRIADCVEGVDRSQRHGGPISVACGWLAGHAFFRNTSREIVESCVYAPQVSGVAHNDAEPMRLADRGGVFVGRRLRPSQIACRYCRHRYQCECRDTDRGRSRMSAAAFEGRAARACTLHGSRTARRGHASVRHPISGQKPRSARALSRYFPSGSRARQAQRLPPGSGEPARLFVERFVWLLPRLQCGAWGLFQGNDRQQEMRGPLGVVVDFVQRGFAADDVIGHVFHVGCSADA
jgi:hypothetical protein